jgi:hypothetical protein
MKTKQIKGHALKQVQHPHYESRRTAMYTGVCECGVALQLWADRLTCLRIRHRAHLAVVRAQLQQAAA